MAIDRIGEIDRDSFIYEGIANFRGFYRELFKSCWQACITPSPGQTVYAPDAIISNPPVYGTIIMLKLSS